MQETNQWATDCSLSLRDGPWQKNKKNSVGPFSASAHRENARYARLPVQPCPQLCFLFSASCSRVPCLWIWISCEWIWDLSFHIEDIWGNHMQRYIRFKRKNLFKSMGGENFWTEWRCVHFLILPKYHIFSFSTALQKLQKILTCFPEDKIRLLMHCFYIQSWSELLAPLVNMIKEGSENKPALLILLIFFLNHKNLTFHWTKTIENGGKSHYEIMFFWNNN